MGPSVCNSLTDLCADLTDVTLADEDTNSILADNAAKIHFMVLTEDSECELIYQKY